MANIGDTVRLKAKFHDWNNTPANVNNIELNIYDKEAISIENITTNIVNNATGEYYYDYVIPDKKSYLIFEFKGELDGDVITRRSKIPVEFVGD